MSFDIAAFMEGVERKNRERAEKLPTEKECLAQMFEAYDRLRELGWNSAIYCPKDGTEVMFIEAGSTGIFPGYYEGPWPVGCWLLHDGGETYPSHPILYKDKPSPPSPETVLPPQPADQ